jgi:hypothetical protein
MSHENLKLTKICLLVFAGVICFYPAFSQTKNQGQEIVLKDERFAIKPEGFYIERVNDQRENETAVAFIIPPKRGANNEASTIPVDFRGGTINAITRFINYNIPKSEGYHKVVIYLKKFDAVETPPSNGRVEGRVTLAFSFALEVDQEKNIPLSTYSSNTVYQRTIGEAQEVEPTLRHMLQNGLIFIKKWMIKQAGSNINLAKKVELSFTDFSGNAETDTVYYSVNRPLTWDDFKSKNPATKYDALVFASIGYAEQVKVEDSIIKVQLNVKVFIPKSASWVKNGSKNDYALNHEQRHFDIAKIIAERFKQRLKTERLPVRNYDGVINLDYLEAYREMDSLQKQYDDETNHGDDQSAQQRWNVKIDTELKQFGVK